MVAGVTAAAVVIPKALAYATIAGLPVEIELYTAFIPMVIYAILGTSRPLSFSTTSTIAILVVAQLAVVAPGRGPNELIVAAITLALLVGAFLLLAVVFRPLSTEHPEDETFPGLLIVRTEGMMTFASAPRIKDRLWALIEEANSRVLLFDLSAVPNIEYTALKLMSDFEEKARETGMTLWLAALNPKALNVVKRSPVFTPLGYERMFFNVEEAVEVYLKAKK